MTVPPWMARNADPPWFPSAVQSDTMVQPRPTRPTSGRAPPPHRGGSAARTVTLRNDMEILPGLRKSKTTRPQCHKHGHGATSAPTKTTTTTQDPDGHPVPYSFPTNPTRHHSGPKSAHNNSTEPNPTPNDHQSPRSNLNRHNQTTHVTAHNSRQHTTHVTDNKPLPTKDQPVLSIENTKLTTRSTATQTDDPHPPKPNDPCQPAAEDKHPTISKNQCFRLSPLKPPAAQPTIRSHQQPNKPKMHVHSKPAQGRKTTRGGMHHTTASTFGVPKSYPSMTTRSQNDHESPLAHHQHQDRNPQAITPERHPHGDSTATKQPTHNSDSIDNNNNNNNNNKTNKNTENTNKTTEKTTPTTTKPTKPTKTPKTPTNPQKTTTPTTTAPTRKTPPTQRRR